MFNDTLIVQSAVSAFNNMALRGPDFFWTAVLALPIFIAAWIFAKPVAEKFFKNAKWQNSDACLVAAGSIIIWFLARENFGVLRDDFFSAGIVASIILFLGLAFLSRRYYRSGLRISALMAKSGERLKRCADAAVPFAMVAVAGACALPDWYAAIIQAVAAGLGILVGYFRNRRQSDEQDPKMLLGVVMFAATFGMTAQPEFFRFGQLGHLTGIHLLFLAAAAAAFSLYFAMQFIRPTGFMEKKLFKRVKLIGRMIILLAFVLFALTESELAFGALFLLMFAYFAIAVRHADSSAREKIRDVRRRAWYAVLGSFGILSAMPLLVALAIVLYKTDERKLPAGTLRELL